MPTSSLLSMSDALSAESVCPLCSETFACVDGCICVACDRPVCERCVEDVGPYSLSRCLECGLAHADSAAAGAAAHARVEHADAESGAQDTVSESSKVVARPVSRPSLPKPISVWSAPAPRAGMPKESVWSAPPGFGVQQQLDRSAAMRRNLEHYGILPAVSITPLPKHLSPGEEVGQAFTEMRSAVTHLASASYRLAAQRTKPVVAKVLRRDGALVKVASPASCEPSQATAKRDSIRDTGRFLRATARVGAERANAGARKVGSVMGRSLRTMLGKLRGRVGFVAAKFRDHGGATALWASARSQAGRVLSLVTAPKALLGQGKPDAEQRDDRAAE